MGRWFDHVDQPATQGLRTISPAEVGRHTHLNDCWVIYNHQVYDLSDFVLDHPGGEDLILQFAGKDLGDVLDDPVQHSHSNSAYLLLEEYLIGKMPADYVAAPAAPIAPPVAPIAGRAAGAVFSEVNADRAPSPPRSSLEGRSLRSPSPPPSRHPDAVPQTQALPAPLLTPPLPHATSSASAVASLPGPSLIPARVSAAPITSPMPPASTPSPAVDVHALHFADTRGTVPARSTVSASQVPGKAESGRPFASLGWGVRRSKDKLKGSHAVMPTPDDQASSRLGKLEPLAANIRQPITRQLGRKSSLRTSFADLSFSEPTY